MLTEKISNIVIRNIVTLNIDGKTFQKYVFTFFSFPEYRDFLNMLFVVSLSLLNNSQIQYILFKQRFALVSFRFLRKM